MKGLDPVVRRYLALEYPRSHADKHPTEVTVAAAPAPRRMFNTAYLRALAAKAKPKARRKFVKIHCKTFAGGLKALLRAFGEQI